MNTTDFNIDFYWKDYFEIKPNHFMNVANFHHQIDEKRWNLTEKEYGLLVNLYSLFVASFKKGSGEKMLEKTISALQNELTFLVANFGFSSSQFLKDIDVAENLLSEIFFNRLKRAEVDFQKKISKLKVMPNLVEFMEAEINNEYTHKVKTELVMKLLIFLGDEKSLGLVLSNKMQGILKNTGLKLVLNGKQTWEDMNNILVFEMMRGLRPYREKLMEGYGHTSKILSYMDRIARNVCLTNNQRLLNNSFELYGLTTENDATSDDSRGDDIAEFSSTYMADSYKVVNDMKKDAFVVFNSWNYTLKYFGFGTASLNTQQVHKLHSFKLSTGLNIVLDKAGFYFFDKDSRTHRLYGKIFHSYFDLVFLLHYEKGLWVEEIMNFLFSSPTLKFAVRVFDKDNMGETYFYEIKESNFDKLIPVQQYVDDFKRKVCQLAKLICGKINKAIEPKVVWAIGQLYKIIVTTERIFVAGIFDQFYNDHNVAYCHRLIEKHLRATNKYLQSLVALTKDTNEEIELLKSWSLKEINKIKNLLSKHFVQYHTTTEDKNYLRLFWKLKSHKNFEWTPFYILHLLFNGAFKENVQKIKDGVFDELKTLKQDFCSIANENNSFVREEDEEIKKHILKKLKTNKAEKYQFWYTKKINFTDEELKFISQYKILDDSTIDDEIFLPSSRFFGSVQYLF